MIKFLLSLVIISIFINVSYQLNENSGNDGTINMYMVVENQNLNDTTVCGFSLELACVDFQTLIVNYQNSIGPGYFDIGNSSILPELMVILGEGDYAGIGNNSLLRYNVTIIGNGTVSIYGDNQYVLFSIIDNSTVNYETNVVFNNIQFLQLCENNLNQSSLLIVDAPNSNVVVEFLECIITEGLNTSSPYINILPSVTKSPSEGITRLNLQSVTVANNSLDSSVIIANYAFIQIHNSTFSKNSGYTGTIVQNFKSDLSIFNSKFASNSAKISGGAIFVLEGLVTIQNSQFQSNSAIISGGAIYFQSSATCVIDSCSFKNNFISPLNNGTSNHYNGGADVHLTTGARGLNYNYILSSNFINSFSSPSIYISNLGLIGVELTSMAQVSFYADDSLIKLEKSNINSEWVGCISSELAIVISQFSVDNSICQNITSMVEQCTIDQTYYSCSQDSSSSSSTTSSHKGISTKDKIIISVIFGLAGLFVLILIIVWCYRRRHHHHHYQRF